MRHVFTFLRFVVPWAIRFGRDILALLRTKATALWSDIPKKVDTMANDWMNRAWRAGAPSDMMPTLYYTFSAVGYALLILAWVCVAFITVWLLYLIF